MAGESLPTVGKILGHTQAQTTVSVWRSGPLVDQISAVGCAVAGQFQGSSSSPRLIL